VIDGFSGDQRFFYGFAQAWRGKVRDDALLAQIKSDPHSPDEFRVTGAVRNHPGFYSTFDVKPGDKMYLAPQDRVSIW
jgi:predicted metalloendopeptidase